MSPQRVSLAALGLQRLRGTFPGVKSPAEPLSQLPSLEGSMSFQPRTLTRVQFRIREGEENPSKEISVTSSTPAPLRNLTLWSSLVVWEGGEQISRPLLITPFHPHTDARPTPCSPDWSASPIFEVPEILVTRGARP